MTGDEGDDALAAAAASGDRDALEALLPRHPGLLNALCGRARFTTWFYRVAPNAALDEARRRARRPSPVDIVPEPRGRGQSIDDLVADQLDVDAAMSRLSPDHRAAVALRDLVGLDYSEIGEVLGIPPGTVRSRIARGPAALADHLAERDDAGNQTRGSEHPTSRAPS